MQTLPAPASHDLAPADPRPGLIAAWLAGRKETTRRAYQGDLLQFARFLDPEATEPGPTLDRFLTLDAGRAHGLVLAFRNAMVEADLASATIARRLAAVRSVVKLARQLGILVWALEVQAPPPEPRRDVAGPDAGERKKLWKAMKAGDSPRDRRDRAMVALLFGLGLRRAEVVSLDLADVDFRAKTVGVVGKGRREKTRMGLPPEVVAALEGWVFARGRHDGALFTRTDRPGSEDRLTGEGLARVCDRLGRRAGLEKKLRPHGFRHAAITSALTKGMTVREARAFSRHADVQTLMRYDDARNDPAPKVAAVVAKEMG